jgi:hypothetical protein
MEASGVVVKILNPTLGMLLLSKLLYETQPASRGLQSQYFLAHTLLQDFEARVSHGVSSHPDIRLSNPETLATFLGDNLRASLQDLQDLEVKLISWSFSSFSQAKKSYLTRQQQNNLLIVLAPALQLPESDINSFMSLASLRILVIVIIMETSATTAKPKEVWKEIEKLVKEQMPEGYTLAELQLDKVLETLTFTRMMDLEKFTENQKEFNQDQKEFNQDQKEFNQDQKEFNEEMKLTLKQVQKTQDALQKTQDALQKTQDQILQQLILMTGYFKPANSDSTD